METLTAEQAINISETSEAAFKTHLNECFQKIYEAAGAGNRQCFLPEINNEVMRDRVKDELIIKYQYAIGEAHNKPIIKW